MLSSSFRLACFLNLETERSIYDALCFLINLVFQTSNCGTARYMAPEVYQENAAHNGGTVAYSSKADIFSLGMVYFFIFEGSPPRIDETRNAKGHFEALFTGHRPVYVRTMASVHKIIDVCLKFREEERPTADQLLLLLRGVRIPGWCFSQNSGVNPTKHEKHEAQRTFSELDRASPPFDINTENPSEIS